jgi:hypothetical protein
MGRIADNVYRKKHGTMMPSNDKIPLSFVDWLICGALTISATVIFGLLIFEGFYQL